MSSSARILFAHESCNPGRPTHHHLLDPARPARTALRLRGREATSCPCRIAFRSRRSFGAGSCKSGAIDIPPPRPKRKPSHPYPRNPDQASPDSNTPTAWQVSPSGNAHLPRSFSRESLGTSADCQPLHPTKSPFAQVQHEPSSMQVWNQQPQSELLSRCSRDSKGPSTMQPQQGYTAPARPSHEAVSAVAAAASAAAAAAAAAVIAAAGHDIQQQLQVCPSWTHAEPPGASVDSFRPGLFGCSVAAAAAGHD